MNNKTIYICDRAVGSNVKPFIIAEMSGNHNQSLDAAMKLVEEAAKAGADAIKLQTYTPDSMTLDLKTDDFVIKNPNSPWHGSSLYDLYKDAQTPYDWHEQLFTHARKLGLIPLSTPFDANAVDFLEMLDCPCYKISSFENSDLALIKKVAQTGKPIIISSGMASLSTIESAVDTVRSTGNNSISILKCTSSYPAPPESMNLRTIPHIAETFECVAGLSDHTLGIGTSIAAVAMGAAIIEKHLTINRNDGGVDSSFSMEPHEFKLMVSEINYAWRSLGKISYNLNTSEVDSVQFRRSIYISRNVSKGEVITENNIRVIRPGYGMEPKFFEIILGKKFNSDLSTGTPLSWKDIS